MQRTQHPRSGFRRDISMALVGCVLVMGTATSAVAQCAYPALELLDFDYINSPQMTQNRGDEHMERHVCITAPNRQDNDRVERFAGIKYEFEGRLLVIDTLLRWLDLDSVAEAWTPLPSPSPSK